MALAWDHVPNDEVARFLCSIEHATQGSDQCAESFSIKGKIALVTGGSRGIGLMIARGFLESGAKVYISSRKKDVCNETARQLGEVGDYGGFGNRRMQIERLFNPSRRDILSTFYDQSFLRSVMKRNPS